MNIFKITIESHSTDVAWLHSCVFILSLKHICQIDLVFVLLSPEAVAYMKTPGPKHLPTLESLHKPESVNSNFNGNVELKVHANFTSVIFKLILCT